MELITALFWIGFWIALALFVFQMGFALLGLLLAGVVAACTALVDWIRGN